MQISVDRRREIETDASFVVYTEKSLVGRAAELRKELEATVVDVAGLFAKIGMVSCPSETVRSMAIIVLCDLG